MSNEETPSIWLSNTLSPGQALLDAPGNAEPGNSAARSRAPWLTIWYSPRRTMRAILDTDPGQHLYLLVFLSTIVSSVGDWAVARLEGSGSDARPSIWPVLIGAWIGIYIWAWLVGWIGRRLGGMGNNQEVRSAVIWSLVPTIALAVPYTIEAIALLVFDAAPFLAGLLLLPSALLTGVLPIWATILEIKCVAEAHRFSAWRALAVETLAFLVVALPLIGIVMLILAVGASLSG